MLELSSLKKIDKPIRYLGAEARQVLKNIATVQNRVALAVPTVYEMGMIDFDLKTLYYVLNNRRDTWCERVFSPMLDFETLLREKQEKLYTLESKTPLRNMDIIITILPNELMYTNMLNILNLGGVPILRDRRKEGFPLIIATGASVINPLPLYDFVDLYIIGEPETCINEIMDKYKQHKESLYGNKESLLESMRYIPGVYIPDVTDEDEKIYMTRELDIDSAVYPKNLVVPSIPITINKNMVQLSKGCDKKCPMCVHKYAYGEPTYLDVDKATLIAKKYMDATGNTDILLMSNCYSTYPGFPEIIYKLENLDRPKVKDISFTGVKLTKDNLWLLKYMNNKEGYPSVIVGGATQELRKKVGININDEDVLEIAKKVFEADFNKIRLKYIIGIPGENYEDFPKMLELANKITKVYKEVYSKSPDGFIVELNIYNFTAKPHTPSEWCAVNTAEKLDIKMKYLIEKNKNEFVVFNAADSKQTMIETLLSRGDKAVSRVIYEAWKLGSRFDMIKEFFSYDNWQIALNKAGVDIKKYLEEQNEMKVLPWDFIHLGTDKATLRREYITNIRSEK